MISAPGHWVFAGTGVTQGQFFGDSFNGSAILGHEADVLHDLWSPTNVEILAVGQGTSSTWLDISDCQTRRVTPVVVGSEMYTFAHPGGGEVFGAPSVAFGGSANADPVTSRVLPNVLRRFLSQ